MKEIITDSIDSNLLSNILNHSYHGIAIVGLDGKWILVSKSICDMLGYTESELLEMTFQEITVKEDLATDLVELNKLMNNEIENYELRKRYLKKNGSIVWAQLSVTLVRDQLNNPKYFISQLQDITDKINAIEARKVLVEIIKERNKRLVNFSNIVTHNLRTHSGNLKTLLTFIEEDIDDFKSYENVPMLYEAFDNLEKTVSHLNEIANETHYDKSKLKKINLNSFVKSAIQNVSALAKYHSCFIENNVDDSLFVVGIEAYLDSIFLNFLTNSIKYKCEDRKCEIKLSSKVEGDFVLITITDNGLGIDLEQYGDRLFSLYQTFHTHIESKGLGLFITKNQIESLGGKVAVTSTLNKGTSFTVYLKKA
ncbi:PAS domain S-box protein [uncultured Lacinutrix sp.]|uniref:sensor histidine kinase n=1 Tax=uncultured Lacinutrix sp. TaxID=574032 RepID=UPI00260E0CC4|nr:sensor histidine kinase [uncultured Lacinutrix sp.]